MRHRTARLMARLAFYQKFQEQSSVEGSEGVGSPDIYMLPCAFRCSSNQSEICPWLFRHEVDTLNVDNIFRALCFSNNVFPLWATFPFLVCCHFWFTYHLFSTNTKNHRCRSKRLGNFVLQVKAVWVIVSLDGIDLPSLPFASAAFESIERIQQPIQSPINLNGSKKARLDTHGTLLESWWNQNMQTDRMSQVTSFRTGIVPSYLFLEGT